MTSNEGNHPIETRTSRAQDVEKDLKRFLFGENVVLTPKEIDELTSFAQYYEYVPDQLILGEGAVNRHLFFLVEGVVTVSHAGEVIATLSSPGDVLGEMSLITQKVCSASNFAKQRTLLLVLEVEKINQLSLRLQVVFSNSVNRLFSAILAKKLAMTNEKARLFEITNRELQQAKKALEAASTNKINELSTNQRVFFKKMNTIFQSEVGPIRDQLVRLSGGKGPYEPTEISRLSDRMQKVFRELEPLSKTFETEVSLRDKRVLLVEDNVDEQINAKMSLGGTGIDFTVLADMESAKVALSEKRFDIVCVNSLFVDLISFSRSLYPETKYVFITSESISGHFHTLRQYPELSTILARHPNDRTFTVKNIATTIRKLISNDIFGMDKYLNWGTEFVEHTITSSLQRAELISKFEEYMSSLGVRGSLKSKSSRVAEELLMNVIYDAPTDKAGNSLYNHLERSVDVTLKPEEYGIFRYACDGSFIAISVVDSFGALTRPTILDYLERCFNEEIASVNIPGKGGGGNGLFQIIQSSSLTIFNVKPGETTEVISLLNTSLQIEKISLHPSFHYFESSTK